MLAKVVSGHIWTWTWNIYTIHSLQGWGSIWIKTGISNYIHIKQQDVITHPWLNVKSVTVWNHSIQVEMGIFLSHMTVKFDRLLPSKTTGHHFYATPSFLYHFMAICEFKLEIMLSNYQIRAKFVLISSNLTFDLDLLHGRHFCQWQLILKIPWFHSWIIVKRQMY